MKVQVKIGFKEIHLFGGEIVSYESVPGPTKERGMSRALRQRQIRRQEGIPFYHFFEVTSL